MYQTQLCLVYHTLIQNYGVNLQSEFATVIFSGLILLLSLHLGMWDFSLVTPIIYSIRGVVTLCARCARAHPLFGSDKCKDLCGHTHFLLRNVPEKDFLKNCQSMQIERQNSQKMAKSGWKFHFWSICFLKNNNSSLERASIATHLQRYFVGSKSD